MIPYFICFQKFFFSLQIIILLVFFFFISFFSFLQFDFYVQEKVSLLYNTRILSASSFFFYTFISFKMYVERTGFWFDATKTHMLRWTFVLYFLYTVKISFNNFLSSNPFFFIKGKNDTSANDTRQEKAIKDTKKQ